MPIPNFPDFASLGFEDQQYMEKLLEREQPVTSELTFANLYVWKESYNFKIAQVDGGFVLLATDKQGVTFFFPPIGVEHPGKVVERLFRYLTDQNHQPRICRVPEKLSYKLQLDGFHIEYDRDNSDYVYKTTDLINLPGRKYHRKKNHLAQFRSAYSYEYYRVDEDLIPKCLELQNTWCDIRDCFLPENCTLAEEHVAVTTALQFLKELGLIAGAVLIEDRVAAFAVAGRLNKDTLVIHFEKANPAYPGLYQIINQEFCADAAASYTYVNREQDLGEPGLRKAKESYYPHHMAHKYVITPAVNAEC